MRMCASKRGRKKARAKCPPVSVAKEFVRADSRAKKRKKSAKK
jgi:hypothetical protein